ncbi:hypothetical protein G7Y89_g5944 [Cudoniella acicularis]|uniref:AMP-dependent synthetase/ligase domain-containing protein n=1 Tax=Cudoniella acicularis TaxID=354080 RepID=A0A8H4W3B7_9HELO|nr:hypothetical protein G7Y89_g5944 [Cudoniella acicularis]
MSQENATQPRLLVNVVDAKAKSDPQSSWLLYAEKNGGYQTITWKQLADAVNKTARWLDDNLPQEGPGQTIAYSGPNDARYYILVVAAAKSKRRFFIPDGRITSDGLAKILKEIRCTAWISAHDRPSTVPGQQSLVFPSLEDILSEDGDPITPYSWNTVFSRHHPRKITYRHMANARTLTACPPQWIAGLGFCLNAAAYIGLVTVMLPPDMDMSNRQGIMDICKQTGARSIITPPSLIENFWTDKPTFDFLKSLDYVCWLGATLNHKVGDELAQHTNLFSVIGSTERAAQLSFVSNDVKMWNSYEFVPEMGPRFELVADDHYELHIDRTAESDLFQCGFYTFPELKTMGTEELYSPIFGKHGAKRWIFRSRKDDLVKLSWLAKFRATNIEKAIAGHPSVTSVVVGGEGHEVPYVITEPRDRSLVGDHEKFINEIYDTVIYGVNEKDIDEIRIPREMVMLSDPALPFKRSVKMTIMRKEVEKMYEEHIESLYKRWRMTKMHNGVLNGVKGVDQ